MGRVLVQLEFLLGPSAVLDGSNTHPEASEHVRAAQLDPRVPERLQVAPRDPVTRDRGGWGRPGVGRRLVPLGLSVCGHVSGSEAPGSHATERTEDAQFTWWSPGRMNGRRAVLASCVTSALVQNTSVPFFHAQARATFVNASLMYST